MMRLTDDGLQMILSAYIVSILDDVIYNAAVTIGPGNPILKKVSKYVLSLGPSVDSLRNT